MIIVICTMYNIMYKNKFLSIYLTPTKTSSADIFPTTDTLYTPHRRNKSLAQYRATLVRITGTILIISTSSNLRLSWKAWSLLNRVFAHVGRANEISVDLKPLLMLKIDSNCKSGACILECIVSRAMQLLLWINLINCTNLHNNEKVFS